MRAGAELADLPLPAMLAELETSPGGLTGEQARARLEQFGPNETTEKRQNPALVLAGYFWAPIPWMIEVALVLSLVLRHWPDAAVIGVLLALNGLVAFAEEHQAANAIAALKQRLATTARVLRDGGGGARRGGRTGIRDRRGQLLRSSSPPTGGSAITSGMHRQGNHHERHTW